MLGELRASMWGTACKLSPWLVRGGTRYNLSSNLRAFPITFVTSECLRELSSIAFSMILIRADVHRPLSRRWARHIEETHLHPQRSGPRRKQSKFFGNTSLKITTDAILVNTNFLHENLSPKSGKYWPFRKSNNFPVYVHNQSNHPPIIKKQLPIMLAKRLSNLSCNHEKFAKAASVYQEAMRRNGHKSELKCEMGLHPNKGRTRKQKIIWFNPLYKEHVLFNIGRKFCRLLSKTFRPLIDCTRSATTITYN